MSIEESLRQLTNSRPAGQEGGFVVFSWGEVLLQFALEKNGVAFNWPNPPKKSSKFEFFNSRSKAVESVLETLGFQKVARDAEPKEFEARDGVNAQCGRDIELMVKLTQAMMHLLQMEGAPLDITLELYN